MADFQNAEGADAPEGNAGFSQEFARLAQEEKGQPASDRHESEPEGGKGQAEQAPQKSDAESQPSGQDTPDIWKDAPPELRDAFVAEQTRAAKAEQVLRTNSGRLSQAQLELNALQARLASGQDKSAAPEAGKEAEDSAERMKQLRDEYPEVAGPILDQMAKLEQRVKDQAEVSASQANDRQAQIWIANEQVLGEIHPDWTKIRDDTRFLQWMNEQPRYVQEAIARNGQVIVDPAETADILTRYKTEVGQDQGQEQQQAAKRARQLEGARSVPAKTPSAAAGAPNDFSSEWKRLSELEKRQSR